MRRQEDWNERARLLRGIVTQICCAPLVPAGNGGVLDSGLYVLFNNVVRLLPPSSSHLMRGWAAYVLPPKTMICIIGYLCRSSLLNECPRDFYCTNLPGRRGCCEPEIIVVVLPKPVPRGEYRPSPCAICSWR